MKIYRLRKLTPMEMGRLMDVDDLDIDTMIEHESCESKLYRMYGNSIVVGCIEHIFDNLFIHRPIRKDETLW